MGEKPIDMHEDELTREIIGGAIEVHRWLGPGLLEAVYEEALCHELHSREIAFQRQQSVPIKYKGTRLAAGLRLDLLVDGKVIVEVKAKESLAPTDKPQLLTYLRLCRLRVGLIINFHVLVLKQGVHRLVNTPPDERRRPADPPDFQAPTIIQ